MIKKKGKNFVKYGFEDSLVVIIWRWSSVVKTNLKNGSIRKEWRETYPISEIINNRKMIEARMNNLKIRIPKLLDCSKGCVKMSIQYWSIWRCTNEERIFRDPRLSYTLARDFDDSIKRLFLVESLIGIYPENERFLIFNIFNRFVSSSMTYLFTNRVR